MFIGLLLGGNSPWISRVKPWGDVRTPVLGNHLSAIFQREGPHWLRQHSLPMPKTRPKGPSGRLEGHQYLWQQSACLSGNGLWCPLPWGWSGTYVPGGRYCRVSHKPWLEPSDRWHDVSWCRSRVVGEGGKEGWLGELPRCQRLSCEHEVKRTVLTATGEQRQGSHWMFQNGEKGKRCI